MTYRVLQLISLENRTVAEAGRRLGLTPSQVWTHHHRAKAKLRQFIRAARGIFRKFRKSAEIRARRRLPVGKREIEADVLAGWFKPEMPVSVRSDGRNAEGINSKSSNKGYSIMLSEFYSLLTSKIRGATPSRRRCRQHARSYRRRVLLREQLEDRTLLAAEFIFSNANATGRFGPSQAAVDAAYAGTSLEGAVNSLGGIQHWSVPHSGTYLVTAMGAQGASADWRYVGGRGAQVAGEFIFSVGDALQIAVGQMGLGQSSDGNGGGGGGSFVVDSADNPLLIAAGGGGTRTNAAHHGIHGQVSQFATIGSGSSSVNPGTLKTTGQGQGGVISANSYGSAGGGFYSNGADDGSWGAGGRSWQDGILGGDVFSVCRNAGFGGFGGGGAGNGCWGGGGGGGYSGGDGGWVAGGGGSFNAGTNTSGIVGARSGHGLVRFELTEAFEPILAGLSLNQSEIDEADSVILTGSFVGDSSRSHIVNIDWGTGESATLELAPGEWAFEATHQFLDNLPDDAPYTIGVEIVDSESFVTEGTTEVTVRNVAPTLHNVLLTEEINEGDYAILSGRIVDPGLLDTFTLAVDWGDPLSPSEQTISLGSTPINTGGVEWDPATREFSVEYQYLNDHPSGMASATYAISVTVTDKDGDSDTFAGEPGASTVAILGAPTNSSWLSEVRSKVAGTGLFDTVDTFNVAFTTPTVAQLSQYDSVLVFSDAGFQSSTTLGNNLADYVDAGGGVVVQTFAFRDSFSFSLGGRWNLGGYSPIQLASNASGIPRTLGHIFDTSHPAVHNVSSFHGGSNSFHNTGSANPNATVVANWNHGPPLVVDLQTFNAGIVGLNFFPPSSHSRSDFWQAHTHGARMMANSLQYVGGGGAVPLTISVNNVAPEFEVGRDEVLPPSLGGVLTRQIEFVDPGTMDVHTVLVDFGDGSEEMSWSLPIGSRSFELNHTYSEEGVYEVSVTLTDDDLGSHADTFNVTVNLNQPPLADSGGPYTISEGDGVVLDASGSSDPDGDELTFAWDLTGDGTFDNASGAIVELTWEDLVALGIDNDNIYSIAVRVDDGIAQVVNATTLTVLDTPPTLTIAGVATSDEGSVYTLHLTSFDPGADVIEYWTVDWGDGTVTDYPGDPSSVTHVYLDGPRNHTIRAWATDNHGTWEAQPVGSNAMVSPDPTFGDGGRVTADFFDSTSDVIRDAAIVQPDGKIVVAGWKSAGSRDVVLARYTADGFLDHSFGTSGTVEVLTATSDTPNAMALDSQDRLWVGGNFGLMRFSADGQLDTAFGTNGRLTSFGTTINAMQFDAQGRLVVAGSNRVGRYQDGSFDLSFNGSGLRTNLTLPGTSSFFNTSALAIDADGGIILGGSMSLFSDVAGRNTSHFALQRLTPSGAVDTTFADDGAFIADFSTEDYWSNDSLQSLAIDHLDRVLLAGSSSRYDSDSLPPNQFLGSRTALIRIDSAGVRDVAFNETVQNTVEPWSSWSATHVTVDGSERILVNTQSGIARLVDNGSADVTFGNQGRTTTNGGVFNSQTLLVVGDTDAYQLLRLGSRTGPGTEGANLGVVRYDVDGGFDTSFAGVGYISTDFQGSTADRIQAITLTQPDGSMLVAGLKQGGRSEMVLARYAADGTPDPGFGDSGFVMTERFTTPTAIAVDDAGRIYVTAGSLVYRYLQDGTPDLDFGATDQNFASLPISNLRALLVDEDGGVLAGGARSMQHPASEVWGWEFAVARLDELGQLDADFGEGGMAIVDFGGIPDARNSHYVRAMQQDNFGRIVIAGYTQKYDVIAQQVVENARHAIAVLDPQGTLDVSFGSSGVIQTDFGSGQYYAYDLAIDSQGRIVSGGNHHLARYQPDGTLDASFGAAGSGKVQTPSFFVSLAIDSDDRVLLGGSNRFQRLTVEGLPDLDFAPGGQLIVPDATINALTLDDGQRVMIAGSTASTGVTGADFLIARYLTTGLAVNVLNVPPQDLDISGPTQADEGDTIQLVGSATDPGIFDVLTYTWIITRNGNSFAEVSGESITFSVPDDGQYVATMRVDDGDGGVSTKAHAITVANVAPTATISNDGPITYGDAVTVSLTNPLDPSPIDTAAGFRYAFASDPADFSGVSYANGTVTANSWEFAGLDAGMHTFYARIYDKDNAYTQYTTTVDVSPTILTVTAHPQTKVYGSADPPLSYDAVGFQLDDDESILSGVLQRDAGQNVGSYAIDQGTLDAGPNYTIDFSGSELMITPAALTVTANDQSKTYGDADPALTFTPSGTLFYDDDYDVISGVTLATVTGASATVGTHAIGVSGGVAGNYNITHVAGTLTVGKAELTVTADEQSKTYGDADPTLSFTPSGTLFYDDEYDVISGVTLATVTGASATAGTHVIDISGGTAANYNITHVAGTLTVGKAELTVTADEQSKTYGDADPALSFTPSGTLFYDDEYDVISGVTLATVTGASATAGTHAIDISGGTAANYNITHITGTLAVDKAGLTVTADDQGKTYGDADPALTFTPSGTLFYDDEYDVISGVTLATVTGASATAGTHGIGISGGTAANYDIIHVDGTLTIDKAELTVTADDQNKTYGDADPTLSFTPSGTLFYDDEYDVISGVTLQTATGADATAGAHVITASGGTADNYSITHVNGTLTVAKAELTATADNQSKTYGDAEPALTYTPSGTLFYDDGYDVISGVTLETVTGADATAGTHVITASGGTADNYNITHVDGALTVAKAELIVTVQDADKVYGDENPPFFVVYSGFRYADDVSVLTGDLTFGTPAETFSDVGGYAVSASGLQAANYTLQFVDGTLTVTQAVQTISWDDPDAILQGTPLSGDQLNATVAGVSGGSAPGDLIYDPDFGTVLPAGFHSLSVTAVETQNYLEATASVSIVVSGASIVDRTLVIVGTDGDDRVHLNAQGNGHLRVHADFYLSGSHHTFALADFDRIIVDLLGGDDHFTTAGNVNTPLLVRSDSGDNRFHLAGGPAVVVGGVGNDDIKGGAGRNVLIGGGGSNTIQAGRSGDLLVGGSTNLDNDDEGLFDLLERWNSDASFAERVDDAIDRLTVDHDPLGTNTIHGGAGHDLVFADIDDVLNGNRRKMTVA